jgi:hypothetical protein
MRDRFINRGPPLGAFGLSGENEGMKRQGLNQHRFDRRYSEYAQLIWRRLATPLLSFNHVCMEYVNEPEQQRRKKRMMRYCLT